VKPADRQTRPDIKTQVTDIVVDTYNKVVKDLEILFDDGSTSGDVAAEKALEKVKDAEPGAGYLGDEEYKDVANAPGPPGEGAEAAFNDAKRTVYSSLGQDSGYAAIMRLAIATALDIVTELENVSFELAAEFSQLAAASATGLLLPPATDDINELKSASTSARDSAKRMSSDLGAAAARREAARDKQAGALSGRTDDTTRNVQGRHLSQIEAVETEQRPDAQNAYVNSSSTTVQPDAGVVTEQAKDTSARLRDSTLDKAGYIVICAAIGNMTRSKTKTDRARYLVARLVAVIDEIRNLSGEEFIDSVQEEIQEQAQDFIDSLTGELQDRIDAIDNFLATTAAAPGLFVSTVKAIGDSPGDLPLLNDLSGLCDLKIGSFCDIMGLMEIAESLDSDLGLDIYRPPRFGEAQLTLLAPNSEQVTEQQPIPGKEASVLLHVKITAGDTQIQARFAQKEKEQIYNEATTGLKEFATYFGSSTGVITVEENNGVREDFAYSTYSFDEGTGVYTFNLTSPAASDHAITLICTPDDDARVAGDPRTDSLAGAASIIMRIDENVANDINSAQPGNAEMGVREQTTLRGEVEFSSTNTAELLNTGIISAIEPHHIGLPITFGRQRAPDEYNDGVVTGGNTLTSASAPFGPPNFSTLAAGNIIIINNRQRIISSIVDPTQVTFSGGAIADGADIKFSPTLQVVRVIESIISPNVITYSGGNLPASSPVPTDPLDEDRYQFTFNAYEKLDYSLLTLDTSPNFWNMTLTTPAAYPHAAMRVASPQASVRVQPDEQADFLNEVVYPQPSDTRLGDRVLPAASTLIRAVFDDADQEQLLGPVIELAGDGSMSVGGSELFSYDDVTKNGAGEYEFEVGSGTPLAFVSGDAVRVPMSQTIYDQVEVNFPDAWDDYLQAFIDTLDKQLNRLEKTFCRLLGGRQENFTAVIASLAAVTAGVSVGLLTTKVLLSSWLLGLESNDNVDSALASMKAIGSDAGAKALSDGGIPALGCMDAGESSSDGEGMSLTRSLEDETLSENENANIAQAGAVFQSRKISRAKAADIRDGVKDDQREQLEAQRDGAEKLARIVREIPE
jgi:hypothetical protein